MLDSEIRLLELCSGKRLGVREILSILGGSRTSSMRLIRELERVGALELTRFPKGRGRPKKIVALSPLGRAMLDKMRLVNEMMIKMNASDIRNAVEQLRLRNRIVDSGVDPYERFIEMNELAVSIRDSAVINKAP